MKLRTVLLTGCLLLGCSGGSGDGGGPPELASTWASAVCEKYLGCCTSAELVEVSSEFGGFASEAECVNALESKFQRYLDGNDLAIEQNTLTYDAKASAECLWAIESESCADYFVDREPDECKGMFRGLVPLEGSCTANEFCVSGYCEGYLGPSIGICKLPPRRGEACEGRCADKNDYCNFVADRMCVARKAEGEPCDSTPECLLVCNFSDQGVRTCGPPTSCDGL